ncbi:diguanylate cyclase [Sphingomonas sp. RB3P16]|uniref:diguanylate cyclase domain-containing protein n=1 Tax=Parasphingomonas frigoris TaxID=3096163 RepID=UPI002FCA11A3
MPLFVSGACASAAPAGHTTQVDTSRSVRGAAFAQESADWSRAADLIFKVPARDEAIPDAGVPRAVAQDGNGFIWLATDAGLARWDGRSFKTYNTEASPGAGALPELMVNALLGDRSGKLWLGMSAEGLLWHDPATETFRRPPNRTHLDRAHVIVIADDRHEGVWVGSDLGLAHARSSDGQVVLVQPSASNHLPRGGVHAIYVDSEGTLWVGIGSRLLRRPRGSPSFSEVPIFRPSSKSMLTSLQEDRQGRLWVATAATGFLRIDHNLNVRRLPVQLSGKVPALGTIVDAGNGELWSASRFGIWVIETKNLRLRRLAHDPHISSSVPEDGLNHLVRDRAGIIWLVGDTTLTYVDPVPRKVTAIVAALRTDVSRPPDAAWSVGAAPDGSIWYGSADAPASRLSLGNEGRQIMTRRLPGGSRDVYGFAFSDRQAFTAGEDGVFALSLDGRTARRLSSQPSSRLLLRDQTLFVGGNGVSTLDARRLQSPIKTKWSTALSDSRVRSMAFTADGSFWVGTARGLNRVDLETGSVSQFQADPRAPVALKANYVSTLLGDRRGQLWAGTIGGGITIFRRTRAGWKAVNHLGRRDGLPHDTVDKLLLDSDGAIWVSTDGGIVEIDSKTLSITPLRAADGASLQANWTGAGDILKDGHLVFASYGFGGLVMVDPAKSAIALDAAPLRFTSIRGGDQVFNPASVGAQLSIAPSQRTLTAEFARLDYAGSRDQSYEYRLFPQEADWTRVDSLHRIARYTDLRPGNSTLMVRALAPGSGRQMRAIGAPLVLKLYVQPHWYETRTFRVGIVLLLVLVPLLLLQLRLASARNRERVLKGLVEHRTAELMISQAELEKLAYSDTLTGLGNRRLYGEVLNRLLASSLKQPLILLLIDLDRFKQVNDELGHDVGDALLMDVANRLTATIRQPDSVFRLGGDEFALIVTGTSDSRSVSEICHHLYDSVALPVLVGDHVVEVSLSVGVAVVGDGSTVQAELVYKRADIALYDAKRAGRGTWRICWGDDSAPPQIVQHA